MIVVDCTYKTVNESETGAEDILFQIEIRSVNAAVFPPHGRTPGV